MFKKKNKFPIRKACNLEPIKAKFVLKYYQYFVLLSTLVKINSSDIISKRSLQKNNTWEVLFYILSQIE